MMRSGDIPCPAPDRQPRPPREPLPPGACDTHAHVLGPESRFPYSEERVYTPPDSTVPDYLDLLAALGAERAVLVQPSVYGTDNRALLAALETVGPGLRGVAVLEPTTEAPELRRLHEAGIRGVRLNLVDRKGPRNLVPLDEVRQLARRIAPFGWHIELLANLDEADLSDLLTDLPVPVVVGHMGYPRSGAKAWLASSGFDRFLRLLEGGSLWAKLTGPYRFTDAADLPYPDVAPVARRLAAANPERLLWGTDWPHVMMKKPMPNDGPLCDLLTDWLPDPALRERVLVDNPAALYGFSEEERLGFAAAL